MKETFYLTNYKAWTAEEVIDLWSARLEPQNVKILIDHLTIPELAESILSFVEIDGVIHLNLGGESSSDSEQAKRRNGGGLIPVKIRK